jgi:hypothetical protein
MLKKYLTLTLVGLVINLACAASAAGVSVDKETERAAKVKADIVKLGTGPQSLVEVKLRNGTRLKGCVKEAAEDHFVIVEENSGASTEVPYAQVKQVKGNNLTKGAEKVVAVAGALAAVFVILFFVQRTGR